MRQGDEVAVGNSDEQGSAQVKLIVSVTDLFGNRVLCCAYLITQSKHDPVPVTAVRHAGVPCPQISDHNVPATGLRLDRRTHSSPRLRSVWRDPGDALAGFVLLPRDHAVLLDSLLILDRGVYRGPEPELSRAVLDREVTEGYVGDEIVWAPGVLERRVLVDGLTHPGSVCHRRVGREPVPDGLLAQVAVTG